jgi:hypothetical protein
VAPGYVFVAREDGRGTRRPNDPGQSGTLVWFAKDRYATDFKVQTYKGEPVLTWWQEESCGARRRRVRHIRRLLPRGRRVRAGEGYRGDLHEFSITPQDTAAANSLHRDPKWTSPR